MIKEQDNKDVTTVHYSQGWMKLDWAVTAGSKSSENGRGPGRAPPREARVRSGMWDRQTPAHWESLDRLVLWEDGVRRKDSRQACMSAPRLLLGWHPVHSKPAEAAGSCLHEPEPESGYVEGTLRKTSSRCFTHAPLKRHFHFSDQHGHWEARLERHIQLLLPSCESLNGGSRGGKRCCSLPNHSQRGPSGPPRRREPTPKMS